VNINMNLAPQELAYVLSDSAADIVVSSPEFAPALQAAAAIATAAAAASAAAAADPPPPAAAASAAAYAAAAAAADFEALCVHAAVWVQPGQPLQDPLASAAPPLGLPQVPGWRSCPYPYGLFVRTDITGAPADLSTDPATAQSVSDGYEQALDELCAFGGRPVGDAEDGFQLYYTSGTTGRPKGVLLSHRVVVLHAIGTILGECELLTVVCLPSCKVPTLHCTVTGHRIVPDWTAGVSVWWLVANNVSVPACTTDVG
jgi:acyl-CoA synthetase (AMP-forming)/AMP-acid ligase II